MKAIQEYIQKVRTYPEDKRRQILLASTITIMVIIIGLWLLNVWYLAVTPTVPIEEGVVADGFKKEWSTLIVGFNSVLESLGGLIKK